MGDGRAGGVGGAASYTLLWLGVAAAWRRRALLMLSGLRAGCWRRAAGGGARCCITTERALELCASYVWAWCDENGCRVCVWSHFEPLTRIYDILDMHVSGARGRG